MEIARSSGLICLFISLFQSALVFAAPPSNKPNSSSKASVAPPSPCAGKKEQKEILMESPAFWRALSKQPLNVYYADVTKCYYKGQVADLYEIKPPKPTVYWKQYRGKATVYDINQVKYGSIRKAEGIKITNDELERLGKRLGRRTGKMGKGLDDVLVLKVTVVATRIEEKLKYYGSPSTHPMVKALNETEFAKALAAGNVYDIRPDAIRAVNPIPEAKVISISNPADLAYRVQSPAFLREKGVRLQGRGLPKKHQPVTIISGCLGEYSAYNAVTLMHTKGYKKLSWYPGGFEAYRKNKFPCQTPKKPAQVQVLDAYGVASMKAGRATVVIDVRQEPKFTILGAVIVPFSQTMNQLFQPAFRAGITAEKLQQKKEGLDANLLRTIPVQSPVIVYGANNYDWRPYKAAIMLKSLGYKNVYWYRDGMNDWAQKVLISPKYYRLNRTVANKDLY